VTTSFSGALDSASATRHDTPVVGTDGVLIVDAAQRVLSADAVLAHIFDFDPSGFEGYALADTSLPKPLVAILAEAADAALAANGVRRARVSIEEGGVARNFSILALPHCAGQEATVTLVVTPAASPAIEEAGTPKRDERTAHLRAEAALFMRDHVLGIVSHDLRGPLNAIHSWGYVLERKVDAADAAAARALGGVRSGVEQQVKLIEQSIDTTRAETRALVLDRTAVALRPLLEHSAGQARASLATRRDVTLGVESALAEEQLDADGERLEQALWVMLVFATEASPIGSRVTLLGDVQGGFFEATATFTASFAALANPNLAHVLEAFGRTQATHPREAARIAWVLALPKRVAEAHGGTFEHTDITDGAEVTLKLRVPASAT
jgi:signal transduction histidine kinase